MSQETNSSTAAARLEKMLQDGPLSERAARTYLERDGADAEQIAAAVAGVDWDAQAQAARKEEERIQGGELLPVAVRTSLLARGFTRRQADAVVQEMDWAPTIDAILAGIAAGGILPGAAAHRELRSLGFSPEQIAAAESRAAIDPAALADSVVADALHRGISRRELQATLILCGFSKEQAREAIRRAQVDWAKQAALAAETFAVETASLDQVARSLAASGFTQAETTAALEATPVGDTGAACISAQTYLELEGVSADYLRETLAEIGYQPEIVESALIEIGADQIDWTETGASAIARRLENGLRPGGGRGRVAHALRDFGYSDAQIERGLELADINWVDRAVSEFQALNEEAQISMDSPRSTIRTLESSMGYTPAEAREAAQVLFNGQDEAQAALTEVRSCIWACGRRALEEGLVDAEYSPAVVADTLENVFFDWNERAVDAIHELVRDFDAGTDAASPVWLRDLLDSRGFEPEQIDYAIAHYDGDWTTLARRYADMALGSGTDVDLRVILQEAGFAPEVIEAALKGPEAK